MLWCGEPEGAFDATERQATSHSQQPIEVTFHLNSDSQSRQRAGVRIRFCLPVKRREVRA
ncbi:hypothetical protein EI94DRAFT_1758492 [Lactarius quietus]|nr:hypothetical protein EI94DRAFT_1758492 [Lactarius quietus]